MRHRFAHWSWICLLLAALATGCVTSSPIQVKSIGNELLFARQRANVLTSNAPSARTLQLLRYYDLEKQFYKHPTEVLHVLDRQVREKPIPDEVFALAELCYLCAKKAEATSKADAERFYLGTVAYAYYYLFDPAVGGAPTQYDPRFRLACDLYNRSLARCIGLSKKNELKFGDKLHLDFMEASIDVQIQRHGFLWQDDDFGYFLFASDYEVRGLANTYQTAGLGVPLIAVRNRPRADNPRDRYFSDAQAFPVTAFLRMNCGICAKQDAARPATLELYNPLRIQSVQVAGKPVPLESDLTTPLGYFLARSKLEKLELLGLFRVEEAQSRTGLYLVQPYEPGKIPVVMVHGLWSSPLAWMQMFNDLQGDPEIREKYQFWFFTYATGNPFVVSAGQLRQSLSDARRQFDPQGADKTLDDLVIVGHSMGGLISKMMVQQSSTELWNVVSDTPLDKLDATADDVDRLKQVFFFDSQPYVKRAIFIATPHQGSRLSKRPIGRLSSALISLPKALIDTHNKLIARNPDAFKATFREGLPTSVDNLSPDSPIIQAVAKMPIDARIKYHSIIGNNSGKPPAESTDGVVPYRSSHLEGAESEYIVPDGHACQQHPLTVLEVRRILLEHLRERNANQAVRHADHSTGVDPK